MASGFSSYLSNRVLNQIFNAGATTGPATVYFLLSSVTASAGSFGTEATGSGYARVAMTANTTNFPAASGGIISNGVAISWPTATGDWSSAATQVSASVADASSAGNELFWGSLSVAKAVLSGDTASIAIGAFSVTLT